MKMRFLLRRTVSQNAVPYAIKYICTLLVLIGSTGTIFGQGYKPNRVLPPPPEAAALGRYGEIPVGYHTGVPNIEVPLYEISLGDFKLPVSLSYHAGGNKVTDIATNVGLGWVLNAGGMISCTVNGIHDFDVLGRHNANTAKLFYDNLIGGKYAKYDPSVSGTQTFDEYYAELKRMADGGEDVDPDVFSYSFGGRSGKFVFDENRKVRCLPFAPLKIEIATNYGEWVVTDESGVQYFFSESESSTVAPLPGYSCGDFVNWFYSPSTYVPIWHLSKILTPSGRTLDFAYENYTYSYYAQANQTRYYSYNSSASGPEQCVYTPPKDCRLTQTVQGKRLVSILASSGHQVSFTYDLADRKDIVGSKALKSVSIKYKDQLVKTFLLQHSYFGPQEEGYVPEAYRLKLVSVQEVGKPPYVFQYENTPMPARNSFSQDHWGYYNGAGNSTLIPEARLYDKLDGDANRNVNPALAKVGILQKISYPTGGYSEFTYEGNTAKFIGKERTYTTHNPPNLVATPWEERTYTFTTGNQANRIRCSFIFQSNLPYTPPPGDYLVAEMIGPDIPTVYFENFSDSRELLLAPNSTYTVKIRTSLDGFQAGGSWAELQAFVYLQWTDYVEQDVEKNVNSGGLRIAKIVNSDGILPENEVRNFVYHNPNAPQFSSGYRTYSPVHVTDQSLVYYHHFGTGPAVRLVCRQFIKSSNSITSLFPNGGASVGYEYVTEMFGANGENGKKVMKYKTMPDFQEKTFKLSDYEINVEYWPNSMARETSYEWLRGLLLEEKIFRRTGSDYALMEETINTYQIANNLHCFLPCVNSAPNQKSVLGLTAVEVESEYQYLIDNPMTSAPAKILLIPYYHMSDWTPLKSKTITRVSQSDAAASITTNTSYSFDNPSHGQPSQTSMTASDGGTVRSVVTYSADYNTTSSTSEKTQGIKVLNDKHVILPVEQLDVKTINGTDYVTGGKITTFRSNLPLPAKIYLYQPQAPVPLASFQRSTIDGNGNFTKAAGYMEEYSFNKYDSYNNIAEAGKTGDLSMAYLWDYQGSYPIAEARNTAVDDIAFTSFEADGAGGWFIQAVPVEVEAMTGKVSYQMANGRILKSGLTASKVYRVSYWTKNNTPFQISGTIGQVVAGETSKGWRYFEHRVTGVSEMEVTSSPGLIDELRLCPDKAEMTTFTYDPKAGVTSESDSRGNIRFYEYDTLQRLTRIINHKGEIIKQFDYQYQSPI